eukprot:4363328-Ditylum_brightwellii.AAC.1
MVQEYILSGTIHDFEQQRQQELQQYYEHITNQNLQTSIVLEICLIDDKRLFNPIATHTKNYLLAPLREGQLKKILQKHLNLTSCTICHIRNKLEQICTHHLHEGGN